MSRDTPGWSVALLRRSSAPRPPGTADLMRGEGLPALTRSAARTLRDAGVGAVSRNVLAAVGIRRVVIFHRRADVPHGDVRRASDIDVAAVTEDTLDAYRTLRPDTPVAESRRRLRAGHLCIGAWRRGRLLSVRWFAPDRAEIPYLRLSCALRPGVIYAYDAFTEPSERRNGLGIIVGDALTRRAAAEGARSIVSAVLPENRGGMALAPGRGDFLGMLGTITLGRRLIVASNVIGGYFGDPLAL